MKAQRAPSTSTDPRYLPGRLLRTRRGRSHASWRDASRRAGPRGGTRPLGTPERRGGQRGIDQKPARRKTAVTGTGQIEPAAPAVEAGPESTSARSHSAYKARTHRAPDPTVPVLDRQPDLDEVAEASALTGLRQLRRDEENLGPESAPLTQTDVEPSGQRAQGRATLPACHSPNRGGPTRSETARQASWSGPRRLPPGPWLRSLALWPRYPALRQERTALQDGSTEFTVAVVSSVSYVSTRGCFVLWRSVSSWLECPSFRVLAEVHPSTHDTRPLHRRCTRPRQEAPCPP